MLRQKVLFAAALATLTVVYFCAGKFGLSLAFFHPSASPVWPASGIALAALLLWGYRLWPAVFLGAFLVNISTHGTIATSLGIATGNTLAPLLGAWLTRRFANGPKAFERARDIFKFVLLAAMLSTAFGATVGATSLSLGGFSPWEHYQTVWLTWWFGNMAGDLILTPLLVIWVAQVPPRLTVERIPEVFCLLAATFAIGSLIFVGGLSSGLKYLALPPLVWAAFRFGAHGTAISAFVITALALMGTMKTLAPFPTPNPNLSLLLMQIFVATITVTALVLAAVVSERTRAETALQNAKAELTRANEDLEKRVRQRTDDLERANSALLQKFAEEKKLEQQLHQTQKMESVGTLAGGIAHDFNNILNIIKGYASLLSLERDGDHDLTHCLKIIDATVDRGAATVQQLLTVARKSERSFAAVDFNALLEGLKDQLAKSFPPTIETTLQLDSDLYPVLADPNQIHQALLNICLNARDAMPEGGKLVICTGKIFGAKLLERFTGAKERPYAFITVSDTGTGMDEATRSRAFEPFFTTREVGQGSGLGLSVAYGIVSDHGGFLDVTSEPNRGTTVHVYLPHAERRRGTVEDRRPRGARLFPNLRGTGQIVLFVDDEIMQVELMRKTLEAAGYRVLTATDGLEAVEIFSQHKDEIAAVVLDIGLPNLNGWEALQKMKEIDPTLKPIIASGNIPPQVDTLVANGELSTVLRKPYGFDEILEKIALAAKPAAGHMRAGVGNF
ncbi:MAG: MASE1 domain-containing protein [Deltaproteobacteria bacterium]|nr:MASE1 domain-containing protein [Deltaproteobacteria bacterium]